MNNNGLTLVELLIVIVVMGILASFSVLGVNSAIENARENGYVESSKTIVSSAINAYNVRDDIWDDNVVTLRELLDTNYVEVEADPWGKPYDLDETIITVTEIVRADTSGEIYLSTNYNPSQTVFKCKIVSETAIIGYEETLEAFTKSDIVYLDGSSGHSIIDSIIESFGGDLEDDLTTDNGDDNITVDKDVQGDTNLNTTGGNDTVTIGDDVEDNAKINLGDGDDILNMNGEIKDNAQLDTGSGNDTVNIKDDIQDNAVVNTGTGDDTVYVKDDLQNGAVLNTGDGNDTITVGDELDKGTINSGSGDDDIDIDRLKNNSTIDAGSDNDTLYIDDVSSTYDGTTNMGAGDDTLTIIDGSGGSKYLKYTDGTFNGGSGNDTLNLPKISKSDWDSYVSELFSGFETIILKDSTITQ